MASKSRINAFVRCRIVTFIFVDTKCSPASSGPPLRFSAGYAPARTLPHWQGRPVSLAPVTYITLTCTVEDRASLLFPHRFDTPLGLQPDRGSPLHGRWS